MKNDAILDAAYGVLALELGEDADFRVGAHVAQLDERRVADEAEHAMLFDGLLEGHGVVSGASVYSLIVARRGIVSALRGVMSWWSRTLALLFAAGWIAWSAAFVWALWSDGVEYIDFGNLELRFDFEGDDGEKDPWPPWWRWQLGWWRYFSSSASCLDSAGDGATTRC